MAGMKAEMRSISKIGGEKRSSKKISPLDLHISAKLKKIIADLSLKRVDIANILGVSLAQVKKYEDGRNKISVTSLYEISNKISVDFGYFIKNFAVSYDASEQSLAQGMLAEKNVDDAELLVALYNQIEDPILRSKIIEILKIFATKQEYEEVRY